MKWRSVILWLAGIVLVNVLVHFAVVRYDMTDDKRYSLSPQTKQLLRGTQEPIIVVNYLDGELNAGFTRLKKAVEETVEEMAVYGDIRRLAPNDEDIKESGLQPTVIHERAQNGRTAQTAVYPYVEVRCGNHRTFAALLKNNRGLSGEENLNHSIEGIEYALAEAIHGLTNKDTARVAFIEGHGELPERYVMDLTTQLARFMWVDRGVLGNSVDDLLPYKALIIADPQKAFSEKDKFLLDQYLMRGGRILWVMNGVQFSQDVLSSEGFTPAIPLDLNLNDMLFRYGVRISPALIQDVQCLPVPVDVSSNAAEPNYQPLPWYYAPLLLTSQVSPITRNVMQVSSMFCSPVEVVGGEDGIRKEILLATSTASRMIPTPAKVDLGDLNPDMEEFRWQYIPVGILLEGTFASAFAHRMVPEGIDQQTPIQKTSVPTRHIVIASGSVIRNEIRQGQMLPMGYDRYSGMQFGNRDMMVNAVLYLCDDEGLMSLRQRELTLRLLNDKRAHERRQVIQAVSISVPILLLAMVVAIVMVIRKKRYTR